MFGVLFDGKVALVTGAGGGIGLTTARAFAEAGASVILAENDAALLEGAVNGLRSTGHKALAILCDVRDRSQVRAMIAGAVETYGRLDAAFNNAGINCDGAPLLETDDGEFDNIIDVNLRGVWNCMEAELRQIMAQGSGAIVNCSSKTLPVARILDPTRVPGSAGAFADRAGLNRSGFAGGS
jgi:NAD(P)-dependent dehydrogenase (short-subunit alcohol dehydrogenase family)